MTSPAWDRAVGAEAEAEAVVRRIANQPKNKPLLPAFSYLLNTIRSGDTRAMTCAEAEFWEAMERRDAALTDAAGRVGG